MQKSVGDVGSRISSSNALQKERHGRVNGDLARSEDRRVKPSVSTPGERSSRRSGSPARNAGARTAARPRVARDRHPAVATFRKEWRGRGTGDAKSTGSYEGSLPVEGILDRNEARLFTKQRDRRSWPASHPPTRTTPSREGRPARQAAHAKASEAAGERGSATGMSEARSLIEAVGRKRPRSSLQVARQ